MTAEVVCGNVVESCICVLTPRHDGAHECSCDGSWRYDEDGVFESVRWPVFVGAREARLAAEALLRRLGP